MNANGRLVGKAPLTTVVTMLISLVLFVPAGFAGATPPVASEVPVDILWTQPLEGDAIHVERVAAKAAGHPEGWRMNMDIAAQNLSSKDLKLREIRISYAGGSQPGSLTVDPDLLHASTGVNVIPPNEDEGSAANTLPAGRARTILVPDDRTMPFPIPDSVTVDLLFGEHDPVRVTRALIEHLPSGGTPYAFPASPNDLAPGEFWSAGGGHVMRSHHRPSPNQRFAEDFGVNRMTLTGPTPLRVGGIWERNEDHLIWGKPVYAAGSGRVVRCANGFLDNPIAGEKLPDVPGGGNYLAIESDGFRVIYAHLQHGTIPDDLCEADSSLGDQDVDPEPIVPAGTFLGLVGNSGNSDAPHFHFHRERASDAQGFPLYYRNILTVSSRLFDKVDPGNTPWNLVNGAALSNRPEDPKADELVLIRPLPTANVRLEMFRSHLTEIAGQPAVYRLRTENIGPDEATEVVVVNKLPDEFSYAGDTAGCGDGSRTTICNFGTLAAGEETTVKITAEIPADLVYQNGGPLDVFDEGSVSSAVFDSDTERGQAWVFWTPVIAAADLSIIDVEPMFSSDLLVGETSTVSIETTVTSTGPSSPIDGELRVTASGGDGFEVDLHGFAPVIEALEPGSIRHSTRTADVVCTEPGTHTFSVTQRIIPLSSDDEDPNPLNDEAVGTVDVTCVLPVAINVKPGSAANPVHPSEGSVPVGILTTGAGEYGLGGGLDATTVDGASVRFGSEDLVWAGGGASETHGTGHPEDVLERDEATRDGDLDLLLHFQGSETGLGAGDDTACVRGLFKADDGVMYPFFGCDAVRMVPAL